MSETAGLAHLPNTTNAEKIVAHLRRDGAVIVDDLAPSDVMDAIGDEMAPHLEATPFGNDEFTGRTTRRTGGLVARSVTARDLLQHPLILAASRGLLDHATNIQVHLTQIIALYPGAVAQGIHRDQWAFDFHPFPQDFDVQCNTIWALDDFTEANGATRLVPGSNHEPDRLKYQPADTVAAEMSKGSVLLYSGSVYHGGGANRTDRVRRALNLTYNVAWLRQEENQYLSVPTDVAQGLPDELLRLIGYSLGAYALGYVDDTRDPLDALRGVARSGASFGGSDLAVDTILREKGRKSTN